MAKIPDAAPLAAVEGAPPSTSTVAPTDFGLGYAAQTFDQVGEMDRRTQMLQARAQSAQDRKSVEPQLLQLHSDIADQMANDASQWDPSKPGFAQDQTAKARAKVQAQVAANPNWTASQKSEFSAAADQAVMGFGLKAIEHEAAVIQQHAAERDQVTLNGSVADFQKAYQAQAQSLHDTYDGSQSGLTQAALQAFDDTAAKVVEAAPPAVQDRLKTHLSALRVEEAAKFGAAEAHGQDAFVYKNTLDQADTSINTISSNPLAYDSVVGNDLPRLVEAMPPGMRKDALHDLNGLAAQARVRGLIQQNNPGQAAAELADGRYDGFLKPQEKEQLEAATGAALRDKAPKSLDEALAQRSIEDRANAETYALLQSGRPTGQVGAADLARLPLETQARYIMAWSSAQKTFAASGPVRDMSTPQVASLAASAPPKPTDPDYADRLNVWETQRQVAADELKKRQEPGAWAFASGKPPAKGAGAAATAGEQDRGAQLQGLWQSVQATGDTHAAAQYAGMMLGTQYGAGIPAAARQIVPQAEAQRLAAAVVNAPPEQKAQAMATVAATLNALPASVQLPDGSYASPRAMLGKQLMAGHLTPLELSAVVDFGGDPAKLGRVTAALNDKTLKGALAKGEDAAIKTQVRAALGPFLTSVAPLPGASDLAEARIDRTALVARSLAASQHMSPAAAARAAAADMTSGYRYVDGYRVPDAVAAGVTVDIGGVHTGEGLVRAGAGKMLAALTGHQGAALYAPAGGAADVQRGVYATQVQHSGRWVTAPDDSGLSLAVPQADGTWSQVHDRYGRPVTASWSELQGIAQGHAQPSFLHAPANAVKGPDGQPMPAVSKQAAMSAISWAINGRESTFRSGVVSPKGAVGQMQVTPATVQDYAPRLGLPVDLERAQHDDAYNRAIGNAAIADHIQHFGATGPGLGLALVAYNAGRGKVEGYTDKAGYHPGWLQQYGDPRSGKISLDDWLAKLPAKETRDYVPAVLHAAMGKLQGRG